ncbi:MAG TPA: M13 family metallopeptidase [Bacteroidaceae bacterium]|nr:M13 family metallopeptidase [Bacteroidaceae bacterium]
MKKLFQVIAMSATAAGLMACGGAQKELSAGIKLENMDQTVQPGQDFYHYACGGWIKNHPLTAEYSRFGSFDELSERSKTQMKALMDKLQTGTFEEGSESWKISELYKIALDSVKRNQDGAKPIQPMLKEIEDIQNKKELLAEIVKMSKLGVVPYFSPFVGINEKNSDQYIVNIWQSGIGLGNRDYYFTEDTKKYRDAYKEFVVKMFQLSGGLSEKEATTAMQQVYAIEEAIAKPSRTRVALRDAEANYNYMPIAEAQKIAGDFPLTDFVKGFGADVDSVNICQPEVLAAVGELYKNEPLEAQKRYLQWQVINESASTLSDEIGQANFDFYGTVMSGVTQQRPRWKRALGAVNGMLGEAVGKMYVEEYFSPEAKARMKALVANLQKALGERIDQLAWMSDATKEKAHEKLSSFIVKVGYPDTWKDYSSLEIKGDNYWANTLRAGAFGVQDMLNKLGKPVDKMEWGMTPQTVNAYYNPTTNEITFPAAILQYPFFDMNADDAFNYGAIGVVIGHEMTHGFDDNGRKYDKYGNLKEWWTADDAKKFEGRAQRMIDFFSGIEVAPGLHANGAFTLGENIADHGGLKVSYLAFKNATANHPLPVKDGLTPDQRFFIAYAGVWANNIRPEEVINRTKNDPHSLGKWRVDGALPQIDAWYKAFNITEKDSMFIAKDDRVDIW